MVWSAMAVTSMASASRTSDTDVLRHLSDGRREGT
jgi:hypothetical protein